MTSGPTGLVPAAGRGVRFGESGYFKELFPLLLTRDGSIGARPIVDVALSAVARAGAHRCIVVVSPQKADVLRVVGGGPSAAMSMGYVIQSEPLGLPHAVRCARPWLEGSGVVFAMPDVIILPSDALARVEHERTRTGADLVLGVFPVDEPERLGPVEVDADGTVLSILDKPATTTLRNSWGVASWSPAFTEFCCAWDERADPARERVLGHVFEAARTSGMSVRAVEFGNGRMLDIGTPHGLASALRTLGDLSLLES